jgi:hypothetical protein
LRRFFIRTALYYTIEGIEYKSKVRKNPVLFTKREDDSYAILSSEPRNDHLRSREAGYDAELAKKHTNHAFQRDEVRSACGLGDDFDTSEEYQTYHLNQFQRSTPMVSKENLSFKDSETFRQARDLRRSWRWTPAAN